LVEDEPADAELTLRALHQAGLDATWNLAMTPEEFTELVQKNSYDIILADYKLPDWNGMESVEILRRERLDVPVILVSGALGELTAVECIKQGAADYVLKDQLARLPGSVRRAIREKQMREDHRQLLEELARSNRDLEQFAYVASHDLQEPLRMVASYTELLSEHLHGSLDEKSRKYFNYVLDGAKRMQQLVKDLLAYSRVDSQGKPPLPVEADAVVKDVLKNLGIAIEQSRAEIVCDRLPMVRADGVQLAQVFQNLIGNALKFRAESNPHIHIGAEKNNGAWIFHVADNGIGIDKQYAERVFLMFQRLHERGQYEGSGIGLAIVKKIVERHGGRIWFDSEEGKGTTFYFTVPTMANEDQTRPKLGEVA
jgi:signal transduction histidine kinase